jgi:hypothetical protein
MMVPFGGFTCTMVNRMPRAHLPYNWYPL